MRRQGYLWYGSDVGGRMGLLVLAGIVLEQTTVMALTLACALLALSQLRGTTGCTVDSQIFYPDVEQTRQLSRRGTRDQVLVFSSIIEPPFLQLPSTDGQVDEDIYADEDADDDVGDLGEEDTFLPRMYKGYIPDLVMRVSRRLHRYYRLQLVERAQGGYGVLQDNGKWNGMMGALLSNKADVAAGALTVRADRSAVVDFTVPFMTSGIAAAYRQLHPGEGDGLPSPGGVTSPLQLDDLPQQFQFGCIPGSLTYHHFRKSNDTRLQKLWHRITTADPPAWEWTAKAGLDRVRRSNGTYIFLLESVFAEFQLSEEYCDLQLLKDVINTSEYAFAVQKESDLLDSLNQVLNYFKERGTLDKLKNKWWRNKCDIQRKKKAKVTRIVMGKRKSKDDDTPEKGAVQTNGYSVGPQESSFITNSTMRPAQRHPTRGYTGSQFTHAPQPISTTKSGKIDRRKGHYIPADRRSGSASWCCLRTSSWWSVLPGLVAALRLTF